MKIQVFEALWGQKGTEILIANNYISMTVWLILLYWYRVHVC